MPRHKRFFNIIQMLPFEIYPEEIKAERDYLKAIHRSVQTYPNDNRSAKYEEIIASLK
jgi:hypothetical protein